MRGECFRVAVSRRIKRLGPPTEAAFGQTFLAQPESLAVVHQGLDRSPSSIAKHEHGSLERILLEQLFAEAR